VMSWLDLEVNTLFASKNVREIIGVESESSLSSALQLMAEKKVFAVPVYSSSNSTDYIGMLNLHSMLRLIVDLFYEVANIPSGETEKLNLFCFTAEDVRAITMKFASHQVKELIVYFPPLHRCTFKELINALSKHERVPIVNETNKIINVVSQSTILSYLARNLDSLGKVGSTTIAQANLMSSPVQTVNINTPTVVTFALMTKYNFSSMATVDPDFTITSILSLKDIQVAASDFTKLLLPTQDFINEARRKDYRDVVPTVNCKSSDTLSRIISKLAAVGIHRLFVREEGQQQFQGIVSVGDVLRFLVKST